MKGKVTFEVHKYAPELNKVFYNGNKLQFIRGVTDNLTSNYKHNIRLFREKNRRKAFRKGVRIFVNYADISKNQKYCGTFDSYKDLKKTMQIVKARHNTRESIKLEFYYL